MGLEQHSQAIFIIAFIRVIMGPYPTFLQKIHEHYGKNQHKVEMIHRFGFKMAIIVSVLYLLEFLFTSLSA